MHDGMMHCVLIQGQGYEPFKVRNASIFKSYLRHLQRELATELSLNSSLLVLSQ